MNTPLLNIEGQLTAPERRIAIVAARFNDLIVERLIDGAISTLRQHNISDDGLCLIRVPGAFELPLAVQTTLAHSNCAGAIALGAVIRGQTPHFDYVAGECAKGLNQASLSTEKPVAFGVLTTDTLEQAMERAGSKAGNKGIDAARTVLEMINLLPKLEAL